MKGVVLTEATGDHRQMFGDEGKCAGFFDGIPDLIEKAKWFMAHQGEARQMAERAYARITGGKNTYRDRLETILDICLNR